MRLLSLDLERYGPFTGRRLAFDPAARLHVVLGPNEAGKSSALAAIADLFFGFGKSTAFDFLHKPGDLRIGAAIAARDGQSLEFRRRKGNKGTLLDAAENPIRDDALSGFLGGLTRDVFLKAFGLSSAKLREGAEELLRDDSEDGTGLFAAASGLHGLNRLTRELEAEAGMIFDTRDAGHRTFYRARDRHKAAREAMAATELRAPAWHQLNDEITSLEDALAGIDRLRQGSGTAIARLERLKRVKPVMALVDSHLEELAGFADLPPYDPAAAARLGDAVAAAARAQDAERNARTLEAALRRDIGGIIVDETILARQQEIAETRDLSAYRKFAEDLPRVEEEALGFRRDLEHLAVRLGLRDSAELERRQPSDAAKSQLAALAGRGREIAGELARLDGELEADRADLARGTPAGGGDLSVDPGPLRRDFDALRPALAEIAGLDRLAAQLAADREALLRNAARLDPPVSHLDGLALTSLPAPETIARYRTRFEELEQARREAEKAGRGAGKEQAEADALLLQMETTGPPPSREAILAARAERDGLWRAIGEHLSGAAPRSRQELEQLAGRLPQAAADADRLADEAIRDSRRMSEYALASTRRAKALEDIRRGAAWLAELAAERDSIQREWAAKWQGAGIEPLTPGEMSAWSAEARALLQEHARLASLAAEAQRLEARAKDLSKPLAALAGTLGMTGGPADPGLAAAALEARLKALEGAWLARRKSAARHEALRESLDKKEALRQRALGRRTGWSSAWAPALDAVGLPAGASIEEAEAALKAWQDVPAALRERDNREQRVRGIRREMGAFEERARALVAALDPNLERLTIPHAVAVLAQRYDEAKAAAERRDEAHARLAKAERLCAEQAGDRRRCKQVLEALMSAYPGAGGPGELVERLQRRAELLDHLRDRRDELARAGEGLAEGALRGELGGFDPDAAEGQLQHLRGEAEDLVNQGKDTHARLGGKLRQRGDLEQGTGAEFAALQRMGAEAELAALGRDWAVLKLGQRLIEEAVKRRRLGREGTLMARAGQLFSQLTGGGFAALEQVFGEDDAPRLEARRRAGPNVPIAGLSEGTRDQLYLALRLAFLEEYALRAEPAPFIADDILVTFDDERTAHGLEVLAAAGQTLQPILFTHHRRVADIAQARLGAAAEIIAL